MAPEQLGSISNRPNTGRLQRELSGTLGPKIIDVKKIASHVDRQRLGVSPADELVASFLGL